MGVTTSQLTKLYLAYFGRPPEFGYRELEALTRVAGLGSASIPLPEFPGVLDLAPPTPAGETRSRSGPSPAERVLEHQRERRLRLCR
jgi:hypothetical protein